MTHAEAPHPVADPLPGMPPVLDPADIYSEDHAGKINPVAAKALPRIYVPNTLNSTVDVIDPATYKVVGHFGVGKPAPARDALLRSHQAVGAQRQRQ